jgi:hypothetical protein
LEFYGRKKVLWHWFLIADGGKLGKAEDEL